MSASDPATPADASPEMFWSRNQNAVYRRYAYDGVTVRAFWSLASETIDALLPSDAVRLVPEEDVDDLRGQLITEFYAERADGLPRGTITAAESVTGNILMNTTSNDVGMVARSIVAEIIGSLAPAAALAGTTTPADDESKKAREALTELIALAAEHPHMGYTAPALAAAVAPLLASTPTSTEETGRG